MIPRIRTAGWAIGLSVAAAAAGAQSTVRISGDMDAAVQRYEAANGQSMWRLQNAGFAASRLNFAGSEDVGGGLAANFMLEMGPTIDNGGISRFGTWNRASWVGLSSNSMGELRLGRMLTTSANLLCQIDLHWCGGGFTGTGIMYNGDLSTVGRWISGSPGRGGNNNEGISVFSGGNGTAGSAESNRKNNSAQYITPRMGGFQGKLMYALGETAQGAPNGSGNSLSATLSYARDNLFVGVGYEQMQPDPLWAATGKLMSIGGTYKFGQLMMGAIYQYETASGTAAKWTRANAWAVTSSYEAGAFAPYLKFGQHRTNGTGAYGIVDGTDAFVVDLGALYRLSKRTALYADFVTDLKGSEGNPAIYRNDTRQLGVGLRHSF